jgi:predicted RNA-binding protein (virulence factor B family)
MLGKIETYKVDRETDIGYTLIKDGKEYFLHRNETNFAKLKAKDLIKGFLYLDKKGREAVTMIIPKVTVDVAGYGKVISVNHSLGCFIDIGISKDILLSKDNLPYNLDYWPEVDSLLLGILRVKNMFSCITGRLKSK